MNMANVSAASQRWMLITTMVCGTLYGVGYVALLEFFPPPSPSLNLDQVVALYAHANVKFKLGVALMLITGGFFSLFSAVLGVQMLRDESVSPLWAMIQLLTAPFQGLLFVWPALWWGIAAFTVDRAPEVTMLAHEAAWLTFVTPVAWYPIMMISVTMVAFAKKKDEYLTAFPRWLGLLTLVPVLGSEFGFAALFFRTGPFAWSGLFPFYLPTFTFLLWFPVMTFLLFRAIARQERAKSGAALPVSGIHHAASALSSG